MNILFITSARGWGGGEVWLSHIGKSLAGRGHTVTVVHTPEAEFPHHLNCSPIHLVPLRLQGDFDPFTIAALYRLMRSHNIHIVCTNMEKDLRLGGIAALLAGVPVIPSREVDEAINDTPINRFYYNRIAAAIMVNSHSTEETLLRSASWLRSERLHVVWKGINVEAYNDVRPLALRQQFGLDEHDRIAGFAGRLDEQKGIPTLLEAARTAFAREPRLHLVIAGEGNLTNAIDRFRAGYGLEKRIHILGFRNDIPAFMKAIDFLVMPSYWEGFGYSAVEAMAAGKAVIGTRTSSLPEVISDGRTGILVPPRSADALADAMTALANDPERAELLGRAGRLRAAQYFRIQSMTDNTEALFQQTIAGHRSRRARWMERAFGVEAKVLLPDARSA